MSDDQNVRVSALLVQAREKANLPLEEAASLIGVPDEALRKYEEDPRRIPLTMVIGLVTAYNLDPYEFMAAFNNL